MNAVTLGDLNETAAQIDGAYQYCRKLFARAYGQEQLDALEADPPNECPNCGAVIDDHASFCGDDCRMEYMSLVDTPSNPCPQQTGAGMGFIGGSK